MVMETDLAVVLIMTMLGYQMDKKKLCKTQTMDLTHYS